MKNLILLELNELNFDAVKLYIDKGHIFTGFNKIFQKKNIITSAESDYDSLEPWIQWPSVHTGKTFSDHKIFRLGDIVNSSHEQFFEKVEREGFTVGAISPMNSSNKLSNPTYFVPDPWTQTKSDNSFFSKAITAAIIQAVNDNSQSKLTLKTIFNLIIAFIFLVNPYKWFSLVKYALKSFGKPWRKALFLDLFMHEIHKTLYKKRKTNFSTLFLNAGAHIQHHYFFNSLFVNSTNLKNPSWYIAQNEDPFLEMLEIYDYILNDLINFKNTELIVATGLSQKPYEKIKYYYRIKNHKLFLKTIDISFSSVVPRMTRDFLILFDNSREALLAEEKLSKIKVNNSINLFEKIDNRGKEIFIVLTYPHEINKDTTISFEGNELLLHDFVTFVAIKNGEHQNKGFAFFSDGLDQLAPDNQVHVSEIHNTVLSFFGIKA